MKPRVVTLTVLACLGSSLAQGMSLIQKFSADSNSRSFVASRMGNGLTRARGFGTMNTMSIGELATTSAQNVGVVVKCSGTEDSTALTAAVRDANGAFVVIAAGQTCAGSDITIPNLRIDKGGVLKPITGHTVTLSVNFEAGPYHAFGNALAGQGTISFAGNSSLKEVYPEWWGGTPSASSTIQMAAFQRAVDTGIHVRLAATLSGKEYILDNSKTPLMLDKTVTNTAAIVGGGMDTTLVRCLSTAKACIQIDYPHAGAPSVVIRDFHLRGAAGPTPGFVSGNFGIYLPGFHDGVGHSISNLVIENMQIDQFGDNGIRIQGPTGPVRIINPVVNDVGNYGIQISPDSNPSPNQSQDVTIDGGSLQGQAKGGIAAIGGAAALLSLTIRDIDIELGEGQTKPTLYLEQVHGAQITGVTLASIVSSLSTGDANIYLADGVYGCSFVGVLNVAYGGLHNIHSAGVTRNNTFMGGVYFNKSTGPGYLYKSESGSVNNVFINPFVSSSGYARGHDSIPEIGSDQEKLQSKARVTNDLTVTASLDFGAWRGGDCQDRTITVMGAADGDVVAVGIPNALAAIAGVTWSYWVSSANTITLRGCKATSGSSSDPAAVTVRASVIEP
jgi:hypothetical protein